MFMKQADRGFDDGSLTTLSASIRGMIQSVWVTVIVKHPLTFHTRQKPVNCKMWWTFQQKHRSCGTHYYP